MFLETKEKNREAKTWACPGFFYCVFVWSFGSKETYMVSWACSIVKGVAD